MKNNERLFQKYGMIGRGWMGVVCKVRQISLDRGVAIKRALSVICSSPRCTARLLVIGILAAAFVAAPIGGFAQTRQPQAPPEEEVRPAFEAQKALSNGNRLMGEEKWEDAVVELRKAAELEPEWSQPHSHLANVYQRLEMDKESDEAARRYFELDKTPARATAIVNNAQTYIVRKKYDNAIALLEPALEEEALNPSVTLHLGDCYVRTQQFDKAIVLCERAVDQYLAQPTPEERNKWRMPYLLAKFKPVYRGQSESFEKQIKKADQRLKVKHEPDIERDLLFNLLEIHGDLLFEEGKQALAALYFRRALEIDNKNTGLHRKVARSLHQGNRDSGLDDAIKYMSEIVRQMPEDAGLREDMAYYFFERGRFKEAEVLYRFLLEKNPDNSAFYRDRIIESLGRQGRADEASAMLLESIQTIQGSDMKEEEKRKRIDYLEKRHRGLVNHSTIIEAHRTEAGKSIAADPENASAYYRIAQGLLEEGYYDLALSNHLMGAWLEKQGDRLVETAMQLRGSRQEAAALAYIRAVFEHFPETPRALDLIGVIAQMHQARWANFFDPKMAKGDEMIVWACERVIQSKAEPDRKFQAELQRLEYKYAHKPNSQEVGLQAKAEYLALLKREGLSDNDRRRVQEAVDRLNQNWLNVK